MTIHTSPPTSAARSSPETTTTFAVRFHETDLMGIVHHANYLHYFELGRVAWLAERGISYDVWLTQGVHLPVVEVQLRYRQAARFGDDLTLETTLAEITRVTVTFAYRLLRPTPTEETLLCEGSTRLACVGDDLSPRRFPSRILETLQSAAAPAQRL